MQTELRQNKRRYTDYVFLRLADDVGNDRNLGSETLSRIPSNGKTNGRNDIYHSEVPTVRSTLPGEEYEGDGRAPNRPPSTSQNDSSDFSSSDLFRDASTLSIENQKLSVNTSPRAEPRKFHLSKVSSASSLQHHLRKNGIRKRKKHELKDLAVFVEGIESIVQRRSPQRDAPGISSDTDSVNLASQISLNSVQIQSRKRPNVNAAEREWRADNWVKGAPMGPIQASGIQDTRKSTSIWDKKSIGLAEELHRSALSQAYGSLDTEPHMPMIPAIGGKTKPKPPPPRHRERLVMNDFPSNNDKAMIGTADEENGYIYDTYIRHVNPDPLSSPQKVGQRGDLIGIAHSGKVGILVITAEDEEILEAYGEDEPSDDDFHSDEEDENGMLLVASGLFCVKLSRFSRGLLRQRLSGGRSRLGRRIW